MTRVAVISGGPSPEAEVSRSGAPFVARALRNTGFEVVELELDRGLPAALLDARVDAAFPVVHGAVGEDGCLQGLLEVLEVPYVGSGVLASALAMNKPQAKRALRAAGLPLAREATFVRGEDVARRAASVRDSVGRELIVKPASGGSAIGVLRVTAAEPDSALVGAVERVLRDDAEALVETTIHGDELTCSVLEEDERGVRALPVTLIKPKADFYDFTSKYRPGHSEHLCPAPLSADVTRRVAEAAVRAHTALGCRDLSRVDFLLPPDGAFVVLEVNTLPGMTATSLFPEAAKASGIEFEALCSSLVRRALARPRRQAPHVPAMP